MDTSHLLTRLCFLMALLLAAPCTGADLYRYTDSEGTVCFTDRPTDTKAVRVLRGSASRKHVSRKGLVKPSGVPSIPAQPAVASGHLMPKEFLLPVTGPVTSLTGVRNDPIDGTLRMHNGVDIAVPTGTEVRPVACGRVVFSGARNGYGNVVIVEHPDDMLTLYAHNSANLVREGDTVDTTSIIARSGSTGRSTGPHLHFEAWRGGENVTELFLSGIPQDKIRSHAVPHSAGIRTIVKSDGSILFTNLNY